MKSNQKNQKQKKPLDAATLKSVIHYVQFGGSENIRKAKALLIRHMSKQQAMNLLTRTYFQACRFKITKESILDYNDRIPGVIKLETMIPQFHMHLHIITSQRPRWSWVKNQTFFSMNQLVGINYEAKPLVYSPLLLAHDEEIAHSMSFAGTILAEEQDNLGGVKQRQELFGAFQLHYFHSRSQAENSEGLFDELGINTIQAFSNLLGAFGQKMVEVQ